MKSPKLAGHWVFQGVHTTVPYGVKVQPSRQELRHQEDDENIYLCSWRTMYRILEENNEVKERRRGHRKRNYKKPELLATGPNQVWSWDITKLRGPVPWTYFYLYVIIDIFSRYVVGWMVAEKESGELAEVLISETCRKQEIQQGELILHSDRGAPMKARNVGQLLVDLGVGKSHSRPYVSDDNPYSESQFKTLKYHPKFPERFETEESALEFCRVFMGWYNEEHRHSSLGLLSPIDVHYGKAEEKLERRQKTLDVAYLNHPERFVKGKPQVQRLPSEVWINPPKKEQKTSVPSPSDSHHRLHLQTEVLVTEKMGEGTVPNPEART